MGLAELFEFRTETEAEVEVPWITEATEELIENIVRGKYKGEQARQVEEVAKRFIRFCRKIGGKPKVREYASRYFGTIDMSCYLGDGRIYSVDFWSGRLSVMTDKGWHTLELPESFNKPEIEIKEPKKVGKVVFDMHMKPTAEFKASDVFGIKEIAFDIYSDHVKIQFRSETYEEVIGRR